MLFVGGHLGLGSIVANEIGLEVGQFLSGGGDEHVLDEVSLPSHLHDEANLQARVLVGTAEGIHHVELLARELVGGNLLELLPCRLGYGLVVVLILVRSPPDGVLGGLVHHEELILGRTAGVDAGHYVHGAHLGHLTLFKAAQTLLGLLTIELVVGGIVDNLRNAGDAILFQIQLVHSFYVFE